MTKIIQTKTRDGLYKEETYQIIGAAYEVYNQMGCGFLEAVYQECLEIELTERKIDFRSQVPIRIHYKKRDLKQKYEPDFICFGKVVVEIKALSTLTEEHKAQVMNYLKATGMEIGLLLNFGHHPGVQVERICLADYHKSVSSV